MAGFYPEFSQKFAALLPELRARGRVVIIGHMRPDGDCIGAQVGLARVLSAAGVREVTCLNADHVPRRLSFLTAQTPVLHAPEVLAKPDSDFRAGDYAAIFVDCADSARCGAELQAAFPKPFAMVDHHLSNPGFAEHDFLDADSAATSEILAGIFLDLGLPIDPQAAQALYTGVVTDTGQFRFPSTTPRCFAIAGELIARGAQPAEIGYELYERESLGRLRLLEAFLKTLRLECGGRFCFGFLPKGIFEATGSTVEDIEGLVDYARSIEGVEIAALVEERQEAEWRGGGVKMKASLRAKNPVYRVDKIAAKFGGGGHACAAGLTAEAERDAFCAELLTAVAEQLSAVAAHALAAVETATCANVEASGAATKPEGTIL